MLAGRCHFACPHSGVMTSAIFARAALLLRWGGGRKNVTTICSGGVVSAARSFSYEDVLPLHRTSSRVGVIKCGHFLQALSSPTNQGLAESGYISTPTLLLLVSPYNFPKKES